MFSISSVAKLVSPKLMRKSLVGIYGLAMVTIFTMTSFSGAAWGYTFSYRDLATGINSNAEQFISYRYMRHVWTASDGAMAAAVQQGGYGGHGLVLYKTLDHGQTWALEAELSADPDIVSDGIMDGSNNLLLVTSYLNTNRTVNVQFIRMNYSKYSRAWSINPSTPTNVFVSGAPYLATRASLAVDSRGIIWCALRIQNTVTGMIQIRVYFSTDGGVTWRNSGNTFGTLNQQEDKCAKVIAVGSRIAMVYQDVSNNADRIKAWAYRDDLQKLQDSWVSAPIATMASADGDPYGSHWSLAADDFGNLHLSYQDNGINYLKYDAALNLWAEPLALADVGDYSDIAVGANNDVYVFSKNKTETRVIVNQYSVADQAWTGWSRISSQDYQGLLRMSTPERFGNYLPLLYNVNVNTPYTLIYDLLNVKQ